MDITVTILDDGIKVLESWLGKGKIQTWLQDALDNKLRTRIDASIIECTPFNPNALTIQDKLLKLSKVKLPTREERDAKEVIASIGR